MIASAPKRILVIFGTRPEAIKLAPVVRALRERPAEFSTRIASTGQHQQMLHQALDAFQLKLDVQLDEVLPGQSLGQLTGNLFREIDRLLEAEMPDWIIVQGDTTSAMTAAVCGYYRRIKVGHVEAGLRTYDRWAPFPEEINRTVITQVVDYHFAPTRRAAANLRASGVKEAAIRVTGNTIVDALGWVRQSLKDQMPDGIDPKVSDLIAGRRMVLVTSHRRESFGQGLENICSALLRIADKIPDAAIVYPVHLNPNVREAVYRILGGHPRIALLEPVGYLPMIWLMQNCHIILTDSGGIQEEAPSFGKPLLILRDTTERPEVIEAGCARLVGTQTDLIVSSVRALFDDPKLYETMSRVENPFGDGHAADYIAEWLAQ